jgi:homoserine kinase
MNGLVGDLEGSEFTVPASISNLGPGFDALSVAVQLYLHVRILEVRASAPDAIETRFLDAHPGGENRIETAFRHARARVGTPAPGVCIEVRSDIPTRAGLGSSGAAAVAGVRLYQLLTPILNGSDPLSLASDVEGHPDNAAAALLGGLAISCQTDNGRVTARAQRWPDEIQMVVATPGAELETAHARRILPDTVSLRDAIFNLQRALLLVNALSSGRHGDLREALRDRWHQPMRAGLVPGLSEVLEMEDDSILGACLSGAGPSIVVFSAGRADEAQALLADVYRRLDMPSTIRVVAAHQPQDS